MPLANMVGDRTSPLVDLDAHANLVLTLRSEAREKMVHLVGVDDLESKAVLIVEPADHPNEHLAVRGDVLQHERLDSAKRELPIGCAISLLPPLGPRVLDLLIEGGVQRLVVVSDKRLVADALLPEHV